MDDQQFLSTIYTVAEILKGAPLDSNEHKLIVEKFNATEGTPYFRAKNAIEYVTNVILPENFSLLEKAGSINNLQNLVAEMKAAANEWSKKK